MLEWKSSQSGQFVQDNCKFGEARNKTQSWNSANSGPPAGKLPLDALIYAYAYNYCVTGRY